jgi:hypothetical protein
MIAAHPFFLVPAGNGVTDWVTPAGPLTTSYTGTGLVIAIEARSRRGRPVTYVLVGGSLPPGLTLNSNSGLINGVIAKAALANTTTFTFVVSAVDG